MDRFYKQRLHVQKSLIQKIAPLIVVNKIVEMIREELRKLIPNAMEVYIFIKRERKTSAQHPEKKEPRADPR